VFAAGMLVLLYGSTALRWAWPALAYSFLVWPVPATLLLGHVLPVVTAATAWTTGRLSAALPLGAITASTDGTLITIATPDGPQAVSIGTACAGFSSLIAWLLIAGAACAVMRRRGREAIGWGTAARLSGWVLLGLIAAFVGNLARIALLFALVHHAGLDATFDRVHAGLGTALFPLVVLGMLLLLPRFGFALAPATPAAPDQSGPGAEPVPAAVHPALLAVTAFALATGMLLGVSLLRLLLLLLGGYLILTGVVLVCFIRSRFRIHAPSRLQRIGLALGGTVLALGGLAALWYLRQARAEQLPSLGWRLDQGQLALITGRARWIVTLASAVATGVAAGALVRAARRMDTARVARRWLVPHWSGAALAALAVVSGTLALSLATVTAASFDGTRDAARATPQADFDVSLPIIAATTPVFVESYPWTKQALGRSSTYSRYRYAMAEGPPLWADVLTTEDADALAYHSVPTCYAFHGYVDRGTEALDIGNGVVAEVMTYVKPEVNEVWSALYWERRITRGGRTYFQRIVLLTWLNLPPGELRVADIDASDAALRGYATQLVAGLQTPAPG
jgi:exosortase/archaeosortase family protein